MSSGALWVRAGLDGQIVSLDVGSALARPSAQHSDPEILEFLFSQVEAGVLAAVTRKAKEKSS